MDKNWWKEAVIYQIYPRSFQDSNSDGIGDIGGIINRLDYLKELGIDVIWLSPVYKSPNDDNGYDISDYQDIMDEFGSMEDFDRLLEEAHSRGIKILMDLVVNHCSDEHRWFQEALASKDSEYRDYFIWKDGKDGGEPNNWMSFFGGPAWHKDEKTDQYYLHLFSKKQPDLNWENEKLRQEIYKMMRWWLDKGVDGFRMDVFNFYSKDPSFKDIYGDPQGVYMNGPKMHDYVSEMNEEVFSRYDMMTVGEAPCVPSTMAPLYVDPKRKELDMIFHFELMDVTNSPGDKFVKVKWTLKDFKDIFSRWHQDLEGKGWNSLFMNNHDQPRMVSRFGNDGEYRKESAKMLATLLHTFKGTPYIYQGEELGMTNVKFDGIGQYRDIETLNYYDEKIAAGENPKDVLSRLEVGSRDNARTPIQWDDSENAGFSDVKPWIKVNENYVDINAKSEMKDPDSVFNYYKMLIDFRKKNEIIVYGDLEMIDYDNERVFSYTRSLNGEKLLVVINFFQQEAKVDLPEELGKSDMEMLFSNYKTEGDLKALRPYEASVYKVKNS